MGDEGTTYAPGLGREEKGSHYWGKGGPQPPLYGAEGPGPLNVMGWRLLSGALPFKF